ncbi:SulP family inorganic anion transporter [Cellulophaga sp. HaHaR_3_176]|uniref:SulP family inorganic anion transporter n=1 Tax=Cellulophaga sp. HaHaR_3_176 TaxID=1942464 RepID=UPI001C1F5F16|nr:SulP family inorganic anion transporter [Cellulophaga sp. HaHaR_3_176]QWX82614.1 SulP family inorganic anion transporter [Cellulophaga sp. HaHaR_3_176]
MKKSKYLKTDIQSGLVVFLVALPLCLGIALASGAPLFAGIISGIIGGIVVGFLSNSQLSVSGPAAGLTAIILTAIATLGSFEAFLVAGIIAGIFQLILGFAKAGIISNYLPSNVIEGMLAAIGIIIILTQLPHAVGYDIMHEGDYFFIDKEGKHQLFSVIIDAINYMHIGSIIVVLASLAIIISFNEIGFFKKIKAIPSALAAVLIGVGINELFKATGSSFAIGPDHLVSLPTPSSFSEFLGQFAVPDFTQITNIDVWIVAATIAAVASIETLLCIEAADKLDPLKRFTNTNTELKAQGIGNIISCLIGGLPMTSVIVRTSANVNSGGRTKISAISHGVFLLLAVVLIPFLLNRIPLASLAAVLIIIGYKLASPRLFKHMWKNGKKFQFIPFIVTIVAIIATDLLKGVGIGLVVSIYFILRGNVKLAYFFKRDNHTKGETIQMELAQEVSFLNKAAIKQTFIHLPANSKLIIDASNTIYIDHDVLQMIKDFVKFGSKEKNIIVELIGFRKVYKIENSATHVTSLITETDEDVSPNLVKNGTKIPSSKLKIGELSNI